jgi:hypothetical protein
MNRRKNNYSASWGDMIEARGLTISDSWQPSSQLINQLVGQGISRYALLNEWRSGFIQSMQQQDQRQGQWDELFQQFIEQQHQPISQPSLNTSMPGSRNTSSPQRTAAMTDDWQPSVEMLKLIGDTICPNGDYIKAQLISFTSHFFGQHHPNWDQKFRQWINNGWNVYGHKKNYAKHDEKGFIEEHTDRSWRDGL